MHSRMLGQLSTSAVGLGTLPLTGAYGRVGRARARQVIASASDSGLSLIDMADWFAGGAVESMVGAAVAGYRREITLSTTGGTIFDPDGTILGHDGSPDFLRAACDASLTRFGVADIDLYYLARVDPAVPIEESVGALGELVAAGKVRHVGLVTDDADLLRRAAREHPIAAVAHELSLLHRHHGPDLLAAARSVGAGVVARHPLHRGALARRRSPVARRRDARAGDARVARQAAQLRELGEIASRNDVSIGRLALAWLLAQGPDVVPVPGTASPTHSEMNAAATRIICGPAELAAIEAAVPPQE